MGIQRYVATDLTHFVGRGMKEEDQYNLMIKIIKGGWLTHPPHDPTKPPAMNYPKDARVSQDHFAVQAVCFCDIPVADLKLHMQKYSHFGVAFTKKCLVAKGASPVFYVANDSRHILGRTPFVEGFHKEIQEGVGRGWSTRSLMFDMFGQAISNAMVAYGQLSGLSKREPDAQTTPEEDADKLKADVLNTLAISHAQYDQLIDMLTDNPTLHKLVTEFVLFFATSIVGYIKCFDSSLPENDPRNYYMEREWRIQGNVQFALADIERIILPRAYAARLRQDLPDYLGQIHFTDDD